MSLLATEAVFAAGGVLEINQVCVSVGCFPGDAPGFPVTLPNGGSYRLTSNLSVSSPFTSVNNINAIEIAGHNVSLDLAGFQIYCSYLFGGPNSVCTGTGSGIVATDQLEITGAEVRNGSIIGFGHYGTELGPESTVHGLRVNTCGKGIRLGPFSHVSAVVVTRNRGDGVFVGAGSVVLDSLARANEGHGFIVSGQSVLSHVVAFGNDADGINAGSSSTVTENAATRNGGDGIRTGSGATVIGNTASLNDGDGIQTNIHSLVRANTSSSNDLFGLRLGNSTSYTGNMVLGSGGLVTDTFGGAPIEIGQNVCNGSTSCPPVP